MMSLWSHLDRWLTIGAVAAIRLYQSTFSPDKGLLKWWLQGRICAHHPHCSAYAREAFERYGFIRGMLMSVERVSQCVPSSTINYDPVHYRVVFFSSAAIGKPFLQELGNDKRYDVVGVVTMPDAPVGRGMTIQANPIKTAALEIGIPADDIQTPPSLRLDSTKYASQAKSFYERLQSKQVDFIVVIAYGKIIPLSILTLPTFGSINVHGSLLPAYRGASPLQSVFLDNQMQTGITIMRMNERLDEGDMLKKLVIPLSLERTVKDLIAAIQKDGPRFLVDTLWSHGKGHLTPLPQDHTQATFCSKITKQDGMIEPFTESLLSIYNKRRAYILWPKIMFTHLGKQVIIEEIKVDIALYPLHQQAPLLSSDYTLNPAVIKLIVKPEGKKAMSRDEYRRGYIK